MTEEDRCLEGEMEVFPHKEKRPRLFLNSCLGILF